MLGPQWRKARRSQSGGNCVEARYVDNMVEVRDSKRPDGPVLQFTLDEWSAFTGGVKDGEFRLPR